MASRARALPVLSDALAQRTTRGRLFEPGSSPGTVRCTACVRECVIGKGESGSCGVRFERNGSLRVPYGYVSRANVRFVESNAIYHVLPGTRALTFGMYGCDLRCGYCHSWYVSQALREPDEAGGRGPTVDITAEQLVSRAVAEGCRVICAAYNEPTVAVEWVHEVFRLAKRRGLVTAMITNGSATRRALVHLRPVTDVYRVDLKGFNDRQYLSLGGGLGPAAVLQSITLARRLGFWVEVVTLVVPQLNDEATGLLSLASKLAAIDANIPWHVNAFQPRYRMRDRAPTASSMLARVVADARMKGLRFVYGGTVDHDARGLAHTRCPVCREHIVRRRGSESMLETLDPSRCPRCATAIPGLWKVTLAR
jgi:pyruvate formate lyase activating enzyme